MTMEPVPDYENCTPVRLQFQQMPPGTPFLPGGTDPKDAASRIQNICFTLWEHPTGHHLAAEHEVMMAEDAHGVLRYMGEAEPWYAWMLACWRSEVLRPYFKAVGVRVKETPEREALQID